MKQGRTIVELAEEIRRQSEAKRDFLADTRAMGLVVNRPEGRGAEYFLDGVAVKPPGDSTASHNQDEIPPEVMMSLGEDNPEHFGISKHAHRQLGDRLGIPARYYDRLLAEAPGLLATNTNHWFNVAPEKRMLRTLDGQLRAFLSKAYRPLDNVDLAEAILPELMGHDGIEIVSCEVTDSRLYLKAVNQRVQGEVTKGDVVQAGVVVSNSEIGAGSLRVEPMIFRLVCLNGMISPDAAFKRQHLGGVDSRLIRNGEIDWSILRDETKAASDQAMWMQVRDLTKAAMEEAMLQQQIERMQEAAEDAIIISPVEAVQEVQKTYGLLDGERDSVLERLIKGDDMSRYGMLNAVTAASQDVEDYNRATDLEKLGGTILELPKHDWSALAGEIAKKNQEKN